MLDGKRTPATRRCDNRLLVHRRLYRPGDQAMGHEATMLWTAHAKKVV
jgi:hypothetical protein